MSQDHIKILSEASDETLVFHYECKTGKVAFNISDPMGFVHVAGKVGEEMPARIDLSPLPKGIFLLCIVDGDVIVRKKFNKS